jgi:putative ABC transport system permease protein
VRRAAGLTSLASFFALVALLLAGLGLYGVLDYLVLQRRRELGIRIAIGAQPREIARCVTQRSFVAVAGGVVAGFCLGFLAARAMKALFYQVRATEWTMAAMPVGVILAVTVLASVPPVIRALRIDPLTMLRGE